MFLQVTFTGSTSVGRGVGEKAGDALKTNTLELGGKSPVIVCPDVNIDEAVEVRWTCTPAMAVLARHLHLSVPAVTQEQYGSHCGLVTY